MEKMHDAAAALTEFLVLERIMIKLNSKSIELDDSMNIKMCFSILEVKGIYVSSTGHIMYAALS
jgi:hypothetical protein